MVLKMDVGKDIPTFSDCQWRQSSLQAGWPSLTITHYSSSDEYDRLRGYTLTPHNNQKFLQSDLYWPLWNISEQPHARLTLSFCEARLPDGTVWHVQRFGPFSSTGGYDWWQMAGQDVGNLSATLSTHRQIYLVGNFMGGVTSDGRAIGYPPLHPHHIHVVPKNPDIRYGGNYVFEHHGDASWCDTSGHCRARTARKGYGKLIDFSLGVGMSRRAVSPFSDEANGVIADEVC